MKKFYSGTPRRRKDGFATCALAVTRLAVTRLAVTRLAGTRLAGTRLAGTQTVVVWHKRFHPLFKSACGAILFLHIGMLGFLVNYRYLSP